MSGSSFASARTFFFGAAALAFSAGAAACTENDLIQAASVSPHAWVSMCGRCGGHVTPGANNRCEGANLGGASAGGGLTPQQQMAMQLASMAGNLLGQALHDAIWGNPQREAADRARREEWLAEQRKIAAEEERKQEERKQRLLAMLKGVEPAAELSLKGMESSGGLGLKLGDEAGGAAPATIASLDPNSALAQLSRAAYFSGKAAQAATDEDAAALASEAFDSALGGPTADQLPPDAAAAAAGAAQLDALARAQREYQDAADEAQQSLAKASIAEQQAQLADELAQEMERQRLETERALNAAAAKERAQQRLELERRKRLVADALALAAQQAKAAEQARTAAQAAHGKLNSAGSKVLDAVSSSGRQPEKDAYIRGIQDASQCFSQNAGGYCSGLDAKTQTICVDNYRNGYSVGERIKAQKLAEAYQFGQEAKQKHLPFSAAFTHPRATGSCRVKWFEAFESGYGGGKFTMIGR